ncbi:MAG: hypothetical protein ACK5LP_10265 [Campylobacteraceae bacterium]
MRNFNGLYSTPRKTLKHIDIKLTKNASMKLLFFVISITKKVTKKFPNSIEQVLKLFKKLNLCNTIYAT